MGESSPAAKALREVALRLAYYPLIQSLCWIFIWATFFSSTGTDQADPEDFFPLLVDTLSSPLLGSGMFIAFLLHQPLARKQLFSSCYHFEVSTEDNRLSDISGREMSDSMTSSQDEVIINYNTKVCGEKFISSRASSIVEFRGGSFTDNSLLLTRSTISVDSTVISSPVRTQSNANHSPRKELPYVTNLNISSPDRNHPQHDNFDQSFFDDGRRYFDSHYSTTSFF
eukprot:CAMPEP_0170090328 /NCGR_PEP_ID=MMETSP0019_2-20121128/24204_1 /TAXON_ID=98059 /ORGANISM="Dinobryon sp., Strain UTEXLB2267" /LENGTH=226 /DNA_ID=CAMNT_0010309665 /DNA_START=1483 /DNA_END=2163 /DNA_ORIENTATION=+